MPGIIDAASKGQYTDASEYRWVYYQDTDTPAIFYVMPTPEIASGHGQQRFHLTEYVDHQQQFVSGSCQITTHLAPVPYEVQTAIAQILTGKGVANPLYQEMPFVDTGDGPERNQAYLNYASADGKVSRTINTIPSLSGDETAVFNIPNMSESEVRFFQAYFGGDVTAGVVQVVYHLTATAHMEGVTVQVHFDAQAAFEYQRTYKWVT